MDWKPIDSAPKDGTAILAASFNPPWSDSHLKGDVVKCFWVEQFGEFVERCREMRLAENLTFEDGTKVHLHSPVIAHYRSHWMPLPPPPESTP